jgi:assimilatory nitrate reductase catalytic subunit
MNAQTPMDAAIRTTCPYCGVGCGVLAKPNGSGGADISGDSQHPANFGKLCSKGTALSETLGLEKRLLHPMSRDAAGVLRRKTLSSALDHVANGFKSVIDKHGPDAVAFYLSGQLLTEDYYVANKLMKGFIGSANVDTNSRLCMASTVAAQRRAFGADTVPGSYEDFDEADLIVLVGSNAAWCHPILFRRILDARERRGTKIVVIDPRRTTTAEEADLFLPIAPGMDTVLFAGLFAALVAKHALDSLYITNHTEGFEAAAARAKEIAPSVEAVAERTGLPRNDILSFFDLFRTTQRVVTAFSQGVNQSAQGTDKANAIINCHLATGRIGRPGMGPFSLTGQPNAMGGREVGGLANQLAAHMNFTPLDVDRVRRFWSAPSMVEREGLKAVQMFEAVERGEIKALWVMATNPAVSLPRAGAVSETLKKLDLLVVSENVLSNDTVESGAHILLPAAAWGEKDGTVTNSERRISRQRSFLPAPGEAMPDWKIVCKVAACMGFGSSFAYQSAAEIFREHAALSAFENEGTRDFDIGAMRNIGDDAYEALAPVQWPQGAEKETQKARFFADGEFFTENGRARFIAPEIPKLHAATSDEFPLRLNTGRIRDQWHSMTRTGLSQRLSRHMPEPFVEVSPADARRHALKDGGFARLRSPQGSAIFRVRISEDAREGSVFIPIHWSRASAANARAGDLVAPATDPFSGQPEAKASAVAIEPVELPYAGFLLASASIELPRDLFWTRVAAESSEAILFAGTQTSSFWRDFAARHRPEGAAVVEYADEARGTYRVAHIVDDRPVFSLFAGRTANETLWNAAKAAFTQQEVASARRVLLLSGKNTDGHSSAGPVICACFGVGLATIRKAIESNQASSIDEIGALLRAGTNCGSCKPELKRILQDVRAPQTV